MIPWRDTDEFLDDLSLDMGVARHGYPFNPGQLEDGHRDLKCRKAHPRRLRLQKPEALMLQSVPL
jgi:hypothetical protein